MNNSLLWFRHDLRLHDHIPLTKALDSNTLLPLYVIDESLFEPHPQLGFKKMEVRRAQFLLETLADLDGKLRSLNSKLLVLVGDSAKLIPEFIDTYQITDLYHHAEPAYEERTLRNKIIKQITPDVDVHSYWGSTLYQLRDIPFSASDIPDVYTNFRKKCEIQSDVRDPLPVPDKIPPLPPDFESSESTIPTLEDLGYDREPEFDDRAVLHFKGGETEGLKRINDYIWDGDHLKNYKKTRNGLLGANYSSKFSPWLAVGALSPRMIHKEVKKYEHERVNNRSTYWMIFELIWRDYWKFLFVKHDPKIFYPGGIQDKQVDWKHDAEIFNRWADGTTGFPFVDANMRELKRTGFMSNRGRQNVASVLAKNLGIDWRWGAAWFESQLIDYDVYSNYGNWAYVAGVGTDTRNRYFHIVNQAKKYDTEGEYVKHWLPELSEVPGKLLPEFHEQNSEEMKMYDVVLGEDYPEPIIDLEESYERLRNGG
ncbi:MAG: DASH family cryptochrome [Bacteroidetes bacterium]|jgi:deoxyribodipyrimidine photo-lyase|nr:DASH family cryptochrome [Bacteroidota bacterium]